MSKPLINNYPGSLRLHTSSLPRHLTLWSRFLDVRCVCRLVLAAMSLGIAKRCCNVMVNYAKVP